MPFSETLKGYYIGHGNWEGVEVVFESSGELRSLSTILLDDEKRVILDHSINPVLAVNSTYEIQPNDFVLTLNVQDKKVGYLVIASLPWSTRLGFVRPIILPVGIISFILALFLVVVFILLVRRFVNPLSDVIYAARAVAGGKLGTRISSEGPQDLRSLSESFNEMASSLDRNDRERRAMFADIAHELRTPLSVIRGRLEGIVDGVYPDNGPPVSIALEETYLLQRLVDDLRLLTLAETRQLHFDYKSVDIDHVIDRVLGMFSAEAREKNISLSFNERSGNPLVVIDPQRFEQVISNLLGNALLYVPEKGQVWITANEIADGLRITVNDDGADFSPEDLPYIFNRFWRKDKSRSRQSGGTGLGLAITKQLVEAQGGLIEARNLPEGGLQVVITLKK